MAIAYGFAEVLPDRVTVLAQIAERAEEIDVARAEAAQRTRAERGRHQPIDMDYERARIALLKALTRIQVAPPPARAASDASCAVADSWPSRPHGP